MSSASAAPEPDAGEPRSLHPATLVLCLIEDLRKWIAPLVLLLFFSSGRRWELWLMLWIAPSMLYETLRYATMRWRITGSELVLRRGLLERTERNVPFDRIQNIDLVQGPLQRLLRVAEVRIETASGSEAEAVLRFLSVEDVEAMRARVFAGRAAPPEGTGAEATAAEPARSVVAPSVGDLVRLGFASTRGTAVILAAFGLAHELDLEDSVLGERIGAWYEELEESALPRVLALSALLVVSLSILLSVVTTVVRLYGFRLERDGDEFRLRCGLLTRHAATIPRGRIQLVTVHESPWLRLQRRASVRIETAGGGGEEEVATLARRWFVPIVRRDRLTEVLEEIVPGNGLAQADWQPLAPRARYRGLRLAAILALVCAGAGAAIDLGLGGILLAVLLPLLLLRAHLDLAFSRFARLPGGIAFREGAFHRRTSLTFLSRVHVLRSSESPFDRRWGMANLAVDTAGAGVAGHRVRIPWLERERALALHRELATEAEAAGFHW